MGKKKSDYSDEVREEVQKQVDRDDLDADKHAYWVKQQAQIQKSDGDGWLKKLLGGA